LNLHEKVSKEVISLGHEPAFLDNRMLLGERIKC
jgi:hypothetical protein